MEHETENSDMEHSGNSGGDIAIGERSCGSLCCQGRWDGDRARKGMDYIIL